MKKKSSTIKYLEKDIPDSEIDFSDIPEMGKEFLKNAVVRWPKTNKKSISIRLDSDILDFFKNQGRGYQSKINAILKSYIKHQNT